MKDIIYDLYGISVNVFIKVSPRVFHLKCDKQDYCLKYIDDFEVENAYSRLLINNINCFLLPLKNKYDKYISKYNDKYFEISYWLDEEVIIAKDLRIKLYLDALSLLHNKSFYSLKVNDGFFEESYEFIEQNINKSLELLENELEYIEKLNYKSPSQWLFLLNNQRFYNSINKSKLHLNKFKELCKDKTMLRVSLVYQNFDYKHINLKHKVILSNDKMKIAPPIYDIKYLFDNAFNSSIDITNYIKDYLNKFVLYDYEIEWLLSLLYIPYFSFNFNDEIKRIVNISTIIHQIKNAEEIEIVLTDKYNQ